MIAPPSSAKRSTPAVERARSVARIPARRARSTDRLPCATAAGDVRIGPVAALPRIVAELGANPRRVFSRAGVRLSTFTDPESRIAFDTLGRLFAEAEAATGCDHLGLLVGARFSLQQLGAVGSLMRNSATVGDALRALLMHLHLQDRGAVPILLAPSPRSALLGYSIYRAGLPATAQLYDVAIAIGYRILAELCGPNWKPLAVQLSHAKPTEVARFRRLFRVRLRFDAELSAISFDASWLAAPIAGADAAQHELIAQSLDRALAADSFGFADRVRGVLHQLVLSGRASAANVAQIFGIHERTVRKRLRQERTTLQQLIDETRFELARQLLENTRMPVSQIGLALGYADLSAFSRAFRGWAGASPRQYRSRS